MGKGALTPIQNSRDLSIPAAIERSRSGRGAHVWLFFSEAIGSLCENNGA